MPTLTPEPESSLKPPASADDQLYKKNAWRLLPLLFICYLFAHLDRINIGFAKAQISSALEFNNTVYGFGAGLFFISYMLCGVPSNIALNKVGPRRWIAIIMVTWGLISAGMLFVRTPLEFYALRFLLGMAEAGFFPGILLFINQWFAGNRRGQATALFAIAIPMAGIFGGPVSGWILETFKDSPVLQGWQWMFLLEGLPVVALGVIVWRYLPDSFAAASWLTPAERDRMHQQTRKTQDEREQGGAFAALITSSRFWVLVLIYSAVMLGAGVIAFWMPTLIANAGVAHSDQVGLLSAIPYVFGCVCMIVTGRSSDKRAERRWHVALPLFATAGGIAIAATVPESLAIVMFGMILACAGSTTSLPMFWQLPPAIVPTRYLYIGIAFVSSCGSVASFLSPSLVGWMRDTTGSTSTALFILAGLIILGGALVFSFSASLANPVRAKAVIDYSGALTDR